MERIDWRNDQIFETSILLGVSTHIMYLLSTGRNAWHETWSQRYKGPTSLHFTLDDAKKSAEKARLQGTVFTIEQVPVVGFRSRSGIAYCAEFHSQESFKMLCWVDLMDYLKIGTPLLVVMDIFSTSDSLAWEIPKPNQDSFVTRVFDLAGNVVSSVGHTNPVKAEPLGNDSNLRRWKSYPNGTDYLLGWDSTESDRNLASVEKVVNQFNSVNSAKLRLASNTLFASAENFAWTYFEKNGELPTDPFDSTEMAQVREEANQARLDRLMKEAEAIWGEWNIPDS